MQLVQQPAATRATAHANPTLLSRRTWEGNTSFIVTLLLFCFLGWFGADRFYLGKTRSALLKLVTFGGFGYWEIIDLLITIFGAQRDVRGLRQR